MVPYSLRALKETVVRNQTVLFFSGGFLLDAATLNRIDAWVDLLLQGIYLVAIATLLLLQSAEENGRWRPPGWLNRFWDFNLEGLHFCFGALFSAYLIFYTKSGAHQQSLVFIVLIGILLVFNEFPLARRLGASLRVALFSLCVASFLVYFVPIVVGKIGDRIFVLSLGCAAALCAVLLWPMIRWSSNRMGGAIRLGLPSAGALFLLGFFYFQRWIPPVPLSLQFTGVFHRIERQGDAFVLSFEKGRWWQWLRNEDNPFYARREDKVHFFLRVYAPVRFRHELHLLWQYRSGSGEPWRDRDRIPIRIHGGREAGFRGAAFKEKWKIGFWRVRVLTEDQRVLGEHPFEIRADDRIGKRIWRTIRM